MLIGSVKEKFEIGGLGLVVVLDIFNEQLAENLALRVGDRIELQGDEGNALQTNVAGIEHCDPWTPQRLFAFLLPSTVESKQVQLGMSVTKLD